MVTDPERSFVLCSGGGSPRCASLLVGTVAGANPFPPVGDVQEWSEGLSKTDVELQKRIERDFNYHAPSAADITDMQALRDSARLLAHQINFLVPESREKSISLTKLEEVVMWSNAGIARNQGE